MACHNFYESNREQQRIMKDDILHGVVGILLSLCGLSSNGMFSGYDLVFEDTIASIMSGKCRSWVSVENTSQKKKFHYNKTKVAVI